MKHGGDIGVSQLRSGARFATKPLPCFGIFAIPRANDLQCNQRAEVGVRGTVGDTHRSTAQFIERNSILARADLVVLEAPELRTRLVRPTQEQAVQTAQLARSALEQFAALFTTCWHRRSSSGHGCYPISILRKRRSSSSTSSALPMVRATSWRNSSA